MTRRLLVASRSRHKVGELHDLLDLGDDVVLVSPDDVGIAGEIADIFLNVSGINADGLAGAIGRCEGNIVEHPLHHRLQPPGADIFHR